VRAQLSQLQQNRLNAASCRFRLGKLMPGPFPAAQPTPRPLTLGKPAPGKPVPGLPAPGETAMAQLRLGPEAGQAPV